MKQESRQVKIIAGLTGGLTIGLAAAAFTLSFNSLTELAKQQGLSVPVLFPLILEGGLIVFSLTALTRSLEGQSTRFQWALVIGSSVTAMSFNIAHAPGSIMARIMWAIPSIVLLLAFENLLTQLRYRVNLNSSRNDLNELLAQLAARKSELSKFDRLISAKSEQVSNEAIICPNDTGLTKANDTRQAQIDERRNRVLLLAQEGKEQAQIASELEVSLATVKRDVKALNGSFVVSK